MDQALSAQGMTKSQLNEEIKIQLIIQKALTSNPKITEKEISDYIEANKSLIPEGTSDEKVRKQAIEQIKNQKQQEKTQAYIKSLQDRAKIINFVQY